MLETNKCPRVLTVSDAVNRDYVECGTQSLVDLWNQDTEPLKIANPFCQVWFSEQEQCRETTIAFKHD